MPTVLFHPTATITCIMVFKAGIPHKENDITWMANWKEDGFIKTRNGRIDLNEKWVEIKKEWIDNYNSKTIERNKSIQVKLKNEKTWAIENYLESDDEKIENNGIYGFYNISPDSLYAISIARTGTVGSCFLQNYPGVIAGDCLIVEQKYPEFVFTDKQGKDLTDNLLKEIQKFNPHFNSMEVIHLLIKKFDKKSVTEKIFLNNIKLSEVASKTLDVIFKNYKSERELFDFSEMDKLRDGKKFSEEFMMQTVMYILAEQHRYSYGRTITSERIGEVLIPSNI